MKLEIGPYKVHGTIDWMAAAGHTEPEAPVFFLHEYKRVKGTEDDPEGQLLIEMIAAREANKDGLPIYGCYIIGNTWRFVLLEGNVYSLSQAYDATDEGEFEHVVSVLYKTKDIVAERAKLIPPVPSI